MNVNTFFKEVFEDILGLDVLGLEYFYPDLVELVSRRTLSTFSEYIFHKYEYYFYLDGPNFILEDSHQPGREYFIDDSFLERANIKILGITGIAPVFDNTDESDMHLSGLGFTQMNSITDILLASEANYMQNMMYTAAGRISRFEMTGDRSFRIFNYGALDQIRATLLLRYPTLASVPEDMKEKFIDLAVYDIKIKLWNELKHMENLTTPGGSVDLKIADYESAWNDRKDFLMELKNRSFSDRVGDSFFTLI